MDRTALKELRKKMGLTIPEFAKKLNISTTIISQVERGIIDPKQVTKEPFRSIVNSVHAYAQIYYMDALKKAAPCIESYIHGEHAIMFHKLFPMCFGADSESASYDCMALFVLYCRLNNKPLPRIHDLLHYGFFGKTALNVYFGKPLFSNTQALIAYCMPNESILATYVEYVQDFESLFLTIEPEKQFFYKPWIIPSVEYIPFPKRAFYCREYASLEEVFFVARTPYVLYLPDHTQMKKFKMCEGTGYFIECVD